MVMLESVVFGVQNKAGVRSGLTNVNRSQLPLLLRLKSTNCSYKSMHAYYFSSTNE